MSIKKLMQHLFLTLSLGIIISCNAGQKSNIPKDSAAMTGANNTTNIINIADSTLSGEWKLMPVLESDTAAGKLPWINFDLNSGKFTGNTGCNSMSGSFIRQENSLTFNEQIITTKMACEGYNEKAFLESLLRTNAYKIEDGILMLMENQTVLSKWARNVNLSPMKKA